MVQRGHKAILCDLAEDHKAGCRQRSSWFQSPGGAGRGTGDSKSLQLCRTKRRVTGILKAVSRPRRHQEMGSRVGYKAR